MNSTSFKITFTKLAADWLPTFLRTPYMLALVYMLVAPLESLYIEFLNARKQHLIRMQHNFQKFSLQKRLNDAFDPVFRRIEIVNSLMFSGVFLYTEAEDDPQYTKTQWLYDDSNPIYLRMESELNSEYDFIVQIPDIGIDQDRLRAEIEYYMLQSKNYRIEIIP